MHESILFVVNPIAGGKKKASTISSIRSWAQSSNVEHHIFETTGKNDQVNANQLLEELQPDKLVSVGGDGTLLLCANLLRNYDTPLGIIPMGSANGMATELGIPSGLQNGLRIVQEGHIKKIDTLSFNDDEDFGIHISDVGLNAKLVKYFEEQGRRGFLGYAEGLLKEYIQPQDFDARILADGREIKMHCLMTAFANASRYGTGARLNSQGKIDDGLMEICVLKKLELTDLAEHLIHIVDEDSEHITVIQCREAEVHLNEPVAFQIDGEVKAPTTKVKVKVVPKSLNVIVPQI